MSEKRFIFATNEKWFLFDNETEDFMDMEDCKDKLNEQQATIKQLQDKLFAMQHTIDNQENAIFHLKDTDDNLRKKNIKIEELSKVVHNLKMVLSSDDEQVAKIVGEQQATIQSLKEENEKLKIALSEYGVDFSSLDKFKEAIGYNEMIKKELEDD